MADGMLTGGRRAKDRAGSRSMDLRQNLFRIPDNISIALGLRWDFIGAEPVDLDASCVAFDEEGTCLDVVFFNHLKSEPPVYMEHTGDNQTGEDDGDDDETLILNMNMIPSNVHYIMVCVTSYTGADFTLVEKASCRLLNLATREVVGEFQLGIVGRHTATLLCSFSRVAVPSNEQSTRDGQPPLSGAPGGAGASLNAGQQHHTTWWDLREINFPCSGYTFVDVLPKMHDFLAVPEDQRQERTATLPDYPLTKDDDKNVTLSQVKMGLGWDGENDLDAALLFLNKNGDYVDHVYAKYGRLKSRDGAAIHSGDKLNGYDVAGDDEFIDLDLNKVEKEVSFIFFIALLYDGFAKDLPSVPHAYCRLVNRSSHIDKKTVELQRYNFSSIRGGATAIIISYCHRVDTSHWEFVEVEESTMGRDYVDVFPIVRSRTAFHDRQSEWARWRDHAKAQFAIEVTVLEARDLGPLEPHQFACHVRMWVCDRKGKGRVCTSICHDRDNVFWGGRDGESFVFAVNRMDVLRVMVYEHSLVGVVNLSVSELSDQLFGEVSSPNNGERVASPTYNAQRRQQSGGPIITSSNTIDDWYPLIGKGITGEVRLQVRQVSMDAVPAEKTDEKNSGGSWCAIS